MDCSDIFLFKSGYKFDYDGQIRRSLLSFSIGLAVVGITSSAPAFAQSAPSQDLVRAIRDTIQKPSGGNATYSKYTYRFDEIDLNGDGIKEVIVYAEGPLCGATRCLLKIFQKENGKYHVIHQETC
jgi:hypothetical protein